MLPGDWINITIIIFTFLGIAIGRFPVFRMNRATITVVGVTLLILTGASTLEQAGRAIDMNTIVLLFAMMIINTNLRLSGFFKLLNNKILAVAKTTDQLLILIIVSSGILSSLFLNDTIVIIFTPFVLEIAASLKRNPLPYLMALATSANIGSVATIVGNPQNIIIGIFSEMPFPVFTSYLAIPAITGLLMVFLIIRFIYREDFKDKKFTQIQAESVQVFRPLLRKSIIAIILMLIMFFSGIQVVVGALTAAALLLLTRRIKPERVFRELDWGLMVFFSSLFILTNILDGYISRYIGILSLNQNSQLALIEFSAVAAALSNLISNVPAVLVLAPFVEQIAMPEKFWLVMAMSTTFAGNLTLLGSVANLIVAEIANRKGVKLSFMEYLKAGLPITFITLTVGTLFLILFV